MIGVNTTIFFLSLCLLIFVSLGLVFVIKRMGEIKNTLNSMEKLVFDQGQRGRKGVLEHINLWEAAPLGICVVDINGTVISSNPYMAKIKGFESQGMPPKDMWAFFFPDHVKRAQFVKGIMERGEVRGHEIRLYDNYGHGTWFSFSARMMAGDGSQKNYILCIIEDINERKREEEGRYLKDKMDLVYRIIGGLSHPLNNKLMGIQGFISLLISEKEPSHPDYVKLKTAERQVQEASNLIRELLLFTGKEGEKREHLDIERIIKKTVEEFKRKKTNIKIKTWCESNLWAIRGNRELIEKMFTLLYTNAKEAMPAGGEIKVEAENLFIRNRVIGSYHMKPGRYVLITFSDSGIGMDEATEKLIFEPFFTTKEAHMGLGLTSVYGIVKAHNGHIEVESTLYRGTTFRIYIPAEERVSHHRKALIIDDEEITLNVGAEMLGALGYQTRVAKTLGEAIKIYEDDLDGFDVVILDLEMDRMNGYGISNGIKKKNPEVKILFSTEYSLKVLESERIMKEGVLFIHKPLTIEALSAKLDASADG
ncbi:MAG: ATP-binding protein [Syntrophorhabdaceae bacterium]|nr:ATP-binding protein [Syntrophorhabdaceae bacterium]